MRLAFPTGGDLPSLLTWAKRLVEDLNRAQTVEEFPTASDDADADTKNVKIGKPYVTPDGVVRRRVA